MLSSALSQSWTTIEKNELDCLSQSKKPTQKEPFKLAYLMRLKTGTAIANKKNEDLPSVLFFLIFPGLTQFKKNYCKINFLRAFEQGNSCVNLIFDAENHPL